MTDPRFQPFECNAHHERPKGGWLVVTDTLVTLFSQSPTFVHALLMEGRVKLLVEREDGV